MTEGKLLIQDKKIADSSKTSKEQLNHFEMHKNEIFCHQE